MNNGAGSVWAVVPIKPLKLSKSRLSPVLTPDQRAALALGMFRHVLGLLQDAPIQGTLVVSRDTKVLSIAREYSGVRTFQEEGEMALNSALSRVIPIVTQMGARAILILPADLPMLALEDVEEIIHLGRYRRSMVIAPDRREDGTNAMLLRPPDLIEVAFGIGSFPRHLALGERANASVYVYRSDRIGCDIDTPADWERYLAWAREAGVDPMHPAEAPVVEHPC